MLERYKEPFFILYVFLIVFSLFFVLVLGSIAFLIGMLPYLLVEKEVWPKSSQWKKIDGFSRLNRYFLGGLYLFVIIYYFIIGTSGWTFLILLVGVILFIMEGKVANVGRKVKE